MTAREKILLLFVLAVAPALLALAVFNLSFKRAETVSFCGDCHTMTPWVADLENPDSKSLAALHYRNRWIPRDQCYTCHVDYGFLGPIKTKLISIRHVAIFYSGIAMPRHIALYKPFPNINCLQCHGLAVDFRNNPAHKLEMKPLLENQLSCVTCHRPIHRLKE